MTNTFTCPDRSDDSANAFWLSNTNNVVVGNVGIAQHIAFRIETRHVMGLVRRRFPLEAEKVGRRGKLKGNIRLERFQDNVAHSSRFGFFNYPLLNLPNGAERGYEGLVVWRCGTGISVHNSKQPLLINNTRLVEVGVGIRAGQSRARVALSNTQIIARDLSSLPFVMKGWSYPKLVQQCFPQIDAYTRNWVRCHGGFSDPSVKTQGVDRRAVQCLKANFAMLAASEHFKKCSEFRP